jgi:hypothetical protein
MNTDKRRYLLIIFTIIFSSVVSAQTFKIKDYYQLKDGNSWNYVAPPTWKGDYISRIEKQFYIGLNFGNVEDEILKQKGTFYHYDATNAAKILHFGKKREIIYDGEIFADGSQVRFNKPITLFPNKFKIGNEIKAESNFVRILKDESIIRGTFELTQKIVSLEDVKVTAGEFKKCLRIESESFWDLGDGRKARTISVYHYAKNVGVVKASARFIIINSEGKETINRLIETDLKSYKITK